MTSSVRGAGEVEYQNWPFKSPRYAKANDEVSNLNDVARAQSASLVLSTPHRMLPLA